MRAGSEVGPYRIQSLVGQGAASEVFFAIDSLRKDAPVALKLLRIEGVAVAGDAERLAAEVAALRRLDHPDIARVLDTGVWQGRAWMALEWLPGHDLTRYARPERLLPPALALRICERLALALGHAHERGFVHRDVKPANVRVHLPADRVKLCDFGIARAADSGTTRTGVILGTPAYMAPEQLAGAAAAPTADLYALGIVLHELLTGRRPFDDEGASMGDILRRVATEPAPDLREGWPDAPPALAGEMARLLSKQPQRRHADAFALADMLARARAHIPGPPAG
jgi:serine/threonine-protein kinase